MGIWLTKTYHVQVQEPTGKKWLNVQAKTKREAREIALRNATNRAVLRVTEY